QRAGLDVFRGSCAPLSPHHRFALELIANDRSKRRISVRSSSAQGDRIPTAFRPAAPATAPRAAARVQVPPPVPRAARRAVPPDSALALAPPGGCEIVRIFDWQYASVLPISLLAGVPQSLQNHADDASHCMLPPAPPGSCGAMGDARHADAIFVAPRSCLCVPISHAACTGYRDRHAWVALGAGSRVPCAAQGTPAAFCLLVPHNARGRQYTYIIHFSLSLPAPMWLLDATIPSTGACAGAETANRSSGSARCVRATLYAVRARAARRYLQYSPTAGVRL
ncbi:hypothetical protein HYPSUDRAFT_210446, partial [Hypholoma sublateritium FD-334 SS-4]